METRTNKIQSSILLLIVMAFLLITPAVSSRTMAISGLVQTSAPVVCFPGSVKDSPISGPAPVLAAPTYSYGPDGLVQFHFTTTASGWIYTGNICNMGYGHFSPDCQTSFNTSATFTYSSLIPLNRRVLAKAVQVGPDAYNFAGYDEDTGELIPFAFGVQPPNFPGNDIITIGFSSVGNFGSAPADIFVSGFSTPAVSVRIPTCSPTSFTSQPSGQTTIVSGQSATLTVGANGPLPLVYHWYQGIAGDTSNPIPDSTSNAFTTPALTTDTSYWVQIINGCGGTANSATANITVLADNDGDGIADQWELNGYWFNGEFVDLPVMGADPNHKDIFVQVDYLVKTGLFGHSHFFQQSARDEVVAAFARVPNSLFSIPNPDGRDGITLHVMVSDAGIEEDGSNAALGSAIASQSLDCEGNPQTLNEYSWVPFNALRAQHFSEARARAIHYCLFGHKIGGLNVIGLSKGNGTEGGSDFLIGLGGFLIIRETSSSQAITFMHELGHNLGLAHGGGDGCGNKPNYLSVMNTFFQKDGLIYNGSRLLDYSRFELPILDESSLDENVGLNGGAALNGYGTKWYGVLPLRCPSLAMFSLNSNIRSTNNANGKINWNVNKGLRCGDIIDPTQISADINGNRSIGGRLVSFNDWAHLKFHAGSIGGALAVSSPMVTTVEEPDLSDMAAIPPFAPTGLTLRLENCTVRLEWIALGPSDEVRYNLYRTAEAGSFTLLISTAATEIIDTTRDRVHTYTYLVTAVSALGSESDPSNTVVIKGAVDLISDLEAVISSLIIDHGIKNSLTAKLHSALDSINQANITAACNQIEAFMNEVRAQSGKKLTSHQASQLIDRATQIKTALCCNAVH